MEIIIVSLIAAATLILWIVFFVKFRRAYSPETVLQNIRIEVDKLLIEISRETDRDITVIENRISLLRDITVKADAKIEELNRRIVTYNNEIDQRTYENEVMKTLSTETPSPVRKNTPVHRAADTYKKQAAPEMDFSQVYPGFTPQGKNTAGAALENVFQLPKQPEINAAPQNVFSPGAEELFTSNAKNEKAKNTDAGLSGTNQPKPVFSISSDNVLSSSNVKRYVVEMAAEGFSADLIAEKLGISMTEAEMIMYMYGRS